MHTSPLAYDFFRILRPPRSEPELSAIQGVVMVLLISVMKAFALDLIPESGGPPLGVELVSA